MTHYKWNKGEKIKLSANFSTQELECKCRNADCVEQKIAIELVDKVQSLRDDLKIPIKVHSAYRCEKHNKAIGGALKSQHVLGNGLDISIRDLNKLYEECDKRFVAVGDGRNRGFIHVDTRADKKRRWNY